MYNSSTFYTTFRLPPFLLRLITGAIVFFISPAFIYSQCPPNIDFEKGTFEGWTCYTGFTAAVGGQNQITLNPSGVVPDRHTIYSSTTGATDPYGGFPVSCPNGSGYSIRLGNSSGGGEAEGVSYEFTIPANKNEYSLIYHYAVVFQDPNHEVFQQPRMQVEISNVTDNQIISCSSFTFIPFGTILPGFYESSTRGGDGTAVWCKNWSAVSINLDGLAGKTIRLFFKTADCTFRRHFGYAYIDVNSECSSEFVGAAYCSDDTAINVIAPYGYQSYTWFNNDFSQVLGHDQSIRFSPPPTAGTTIAVEVIPYNGYGCIDTLYARLLDTLTIQAFAGPDRLYCGDEPVHLGTNPKPGFVYSWTPDTNLTNPAIANPLASPLASTAYILSVRNYGGGCLSKDTVMVTSASLDNSLELVGKAVFCEGTLDSAVLRVNPADSIQWYKDGIAIRGATKTAYRVTQSGTYYARLFSAVGCIVNTKAQTIVVDKPRTGIRYPTEYAVIESPYELRARSFGVSVLWSPVVYLNNPALLTPTFTSPEDQEYTIKIVTATGCITVDTLLVKVAPRAGIFVPSAFTPNGDGRNDLLQPVLMGIKELRFFRIYNRWGQLLFETRTPNTGWNGKIAGKDQSSSVVVWVAEGLGADNRIYTLKGTTVLIR